VSEGTEANAGAPARYSSALGMEGRYVYGACGWRKRIKEWSFLQWGEEGYGDSGDIQEFNVRQWGTGKMGEALVAYEIVASGELEASFDAIIPIL